MGYEDEINFQTALFGSAFNWIDAGNVSYQLGTALAPLTYNAPVAIG